MEADKIFCQVLATWWNDSSSKSNEFVQRQYISIMLIKEKVEVSDPLIALMDDSDNEEEKPVTLLEIKENLKDNP